MDLHQKDMTIKTAIQLLEYLLFIHKTILKLKEYYITSEMDEWTRVSVFLFIDLFL